MADPSPRLCVEKISKRFGPTAALTEVSLRAGAGEVYAVLGENGAGKSTLMKILAGAERADAGTVLLDGRDYAPRDAREARRAGVAMVHQEPLLCADLTVAENVVLGDEPARWGIVNRRALLTRARRALEQVQGEEAIDEGARAGALSVGTRQLVSIARALAGREPARVIILDEPTSCLTAPEAQRLFAVLRRLSDGGATVLYISHLLEEVAALADRYTVLRDGRSVAAGPWQSTSLPEIVRLMSGRSVEQSRGGGAQGGRTAGEVILQLEAVAGRVKPQSATLELRRGEVLGIAGLIGSGRSELLRAIFGLDPVRRGTVRVGAVVGPCSPARRLAQGVGMSSEDRQREGLALSMSVADNVTLSKLEPFGPFGLVLPRRQQRAAQRWIDELGIRCHDSGQLVSELSGGNQQKVALARLLHHGVDVLLLDEPTRGIDVGSRAQIYQKIDELSRDRKAVLLVSSQLSELLAICDRIAVMCKGILGPARDAKDCDEHTLLMEATGAR